MPTVTITCFGSKDTLAPSETEEKTFLLEDPQRHLFDDIGSDFLTRDLFALAVAKFAFDADNGPYEKRIMEKRSLSVGDMITVEFGTRDPVYVVIKDFGFFLTPGEAGKYVKNKLEKAESSLSRHAKVNGLPLNRSFDELVSTTNRPLARIIQNAMDVAVKMAFLRVLPNGVLEPALS